MSDLLNERLNKIEVEGGTEEQKIVFATALYHASMTPTTVPIAARQIAITASAIRTSMIVKPALPPAFSRRAARNNFNPSRQPIDANFVTVVAPRQHNGTAARHTVRKETHSRERRTIVATLGQQRRYDDIVGNVQSLAGRAGAN